MPRLLHRAAALAAAALLALPALAQEAFTFVTNWTAQAEQGGYYQALATGLYRRAGLDVTLRIGGPQLNALQIMAAGQADCVLGASDLQTIQARASGVPVVTVAAMFQKDPEVLIAHEDVRGLDDMAGRTILVSGQAQRGFWPWLKARYGHTDAQVRPYTFNLQPFMADPKLVQQGYATAEPYALQKAGVRFKAFMLADQGYPGYASTIVCMDRTVARRHTAVAAFVRATAEGWKSYLADPAPGNALIRRDNPTMTEDQLAYSVARLRELHIVTGGDAPRLGIGSVTEARQRATFDFMVAAHLVDPQQVALASAYTTEFVRDLRVLP